jgi:hypothetical protein
VAVHKEAKVVSTLKQEKKRELHEPRENSANSWYTLKND